MVSCFWRSVSSRCMALHALVWIGDTLAAVADLWVDADFAAAPDVPGLALAWHDAADPPVGENALLD